MNGSPQDPAEVLAYARPCHFCGGRPAIEWLDDVRFVIKCAGKTCQEKPSTEPRTDAGGDSPAEERRSADTWSRAIAEWNSIARLQPRLPLSKP